MARRIAIATDAASIGVWDMDLVARRRFATPTYFAMLGDDPDTKPVHDDNWVQRVHTDDRASVVRITADAIAGGIGARYEYEARKRMADGSHRWFHVLGRVTQRDGRGRPARLMGVQIDVTERRRSDAELQRLQPGPGQVAVRTGLPGRSLLRGGADRRLPGGMDR